MHVPVFCFILFLIFQPLFFMCLVCNESTVTFSINKHYFIVFVFACMRLFNSIQFKDHVDSPPSSKVHYGRALYSFRKTKTWLHVCVLCRFLIRETAHLAHWHS